MWQELNETNQTESGDDFFQEELLKRKAGMPPPLSLPFFFLNFCLEFEDRCLTENMLAL